jgi:hypothetical protein
MKDKELIFIIGVLMLCMALIVLGFNIHDLPPGRQANIALSESSGMKYMLKSRVNSTDLLYLSDDNDTLIITVRGNFQPCFTLGDTIIIRHK